MKKLKRIKIVILVAVLALSVVFGTGCRVEMAKKLVDGVWSLNLELCEEPKYMADIFESFDMEISASSVNITVKYTDEFTKSGYSCNPKSGTYSISSISSGSSDSCSITFYDGIGVTEESGMGNFQDQYGTWLYLYNSWTMYYENDRIMLPNCHILDKDGNFLKMDESGYWEPPFNLFFTKAGLDYKPSDGNGGGGGNGEVTDTKFKDIKTAYRNAGYDVDIGEDDLDGSTAMLVTQMKNMYAAMGCEVCVIAKNLDSQDVTSMEMYMLFGVPKESDAKQIEDGYKGSYPCVRNGECVLVYIWTVGTPNFEPFDSVALR